LLWNPTTAKNLVLNYFILCTDTPAPFIYVFTCSSPAEQQRTTLSFLFLLQTEQKIKNQPTSNNGETFGERVEKFGGRARQRGSIFRRSTKQRSRVGHEADDW
jgi:hypothetical protein